MPIEIKCPACQGRFRVPDTAAGKRIKCPKCKGVLDVPATPSDVKPVELWTFKTEEGEEYPDVTRAELDQWFEEGRITADSQLLLKGSAQWQWATDVYPQLEQAEETPQPSAEDAPSPTVGGFPIAAEPTGASGRIVAKKGKGKSKSKLRSSSSGHEASGEIGDKKMVIAVLLAFFLGGFGAQRFYLGYTTLAIVQLCTCGGCGIWTLVDIVLILTDKLPDAQGRKLQK